MNGTYLKFIREDDGTKVEVNGNGGDIAVMIAEVLCQHENIYMIVEGALLISKRLKEHK